MQLRCFKVGGHNGPQKPVIVVLTGGAAELCELLFAKDAPDYDRILRHYPCHLRFGSLNDNEFVPLLLAPIVSTGDLASAALCILDSFPRDKQRLIADGCLSAPTSESQVTLTASAPNMAGASALSLKVNCCVASGYTLSPEFVTRLLLRCGGVAG